jgi:ketosteroid isomerase-like protein
MSVLRIQTSEMMETSDAETVLRVLEWSFRDISVDVVREGSRITVRGLGPSQRTMNRNDIAVVEVVCEDHRTVIRADITYQASALLGGISQDDLVRSKLDRVLERVKAELGTERVRVEDVPWLADPVSEPEAYVEPEPMVEPDSVFQQEHAVEVEHGLELERMIEPEAAGNPERLVEIEPAGAEEPTVEVDAARAVEPAIESESTHAVEPVVELEPEAPVVPSVATETVPIEAAVEKPTASSASSSRVEIPMFQTFHPEDTKTPKRWGLLATVACMLAAVALFVAWPYLVGLVHERLNPSSSAEESVAGDTTETPKLSAGKVPLHEPDANTLAARNASIHNESDPKVWLESWADAMRGQDAGAQAAFYADPVEHYALKSNVSNADVWLDKKNAIQSRPSGWKVTLEDVVVEPRPDESMRVRLTKHISSQANGGRVSEQFIHSQLKLRKIDGQWKITSEQNLRP